jgi:hypothetical protein
VPLSLLRKGILVNFDLRDEAGGSLPLLNTSQNSVVAEAILVALARAVLDGNVPEAIRCDLRSVVSSPADEADEALSKLYGERDPVADERGLLRDSALFRTFADAFAYRFLALTMIRLHRQQRRVLHVAYDEIFWLNASRRPLQTLAPLGVGQDRLTLFPVPAVGDADTYHFEAEAPEGLQISTREAYFAPSGSSVAAQPVSKSGSFQRSHVYFPQAEQGSQAIVSIRLRVRPATIVRGAFFAALLAFAAILFTQLRFAHIEKSSESVAAATALLVAFPGVVSLYVARSDENPMTTSLLWPIRLVAILPALWSFLAAGAVVGGTTGVPTRVFLWVMVGLAALNAAVLGRIWGVASGTGRQG